jgi:F0F1-type ATP synthase epsilon subunit
LEVLSPGTVILRVDKVKKVIAHTEDGQIGIFPGHTLMLAETVDGPLTYETSTGVETVSISGGILKVSGSSVVVFSGGFHDLLEGDLPQLNLNEVQADSEFSRLTTELSRRLKLS